MTWRAGRRIAELDAAGAGGYDAGLRPVVALAGTAKNGSGAGPALVVCMKRLELELASDRAASVRTFESLLTAAAAQPVTLILNYQDCGAQAVGFCLYIIILFFVIRLFVYI